MKLFKSLLVAPAALGLLAPMTATANELNLNDVSGYSSSEEVQNISDFDPAEEIAVTNSRVDGLESRFNDFEAGSFSETTTLDGSASFLIGAVDGGTTETVQSSYVWDIDLDTSFTGDDKLEVGIAAGNSGAEVGASDALDFGEATADAVKVIDLNYTFPVGDAMTVQVGDSLKISKQFTSACTYSSFVDVLGDCGDSGAHGVSGDVTLTSSYDFGNGFGVAAGVAGDGGSGGLLTKASTDQIGANASYLTDTWGLSVAYATSEGTKKYTTSPVGEYIEDTTYWGVHGSYTPESTNFSLSAGYGTVNPEDSNTDSSQWMFGIGIDEVGPGSVGIGIGTNGAQSDTAADELLVYEVHYTYPINDGMEAQFGVYQIEKATGTDDETGVALVTTFSF